MSPFESDFNPNEYFTFRCVGKNKKKIIILVDKLANDALNVLKAERELYAHQNNKLFFASVAKG